jgi:hypothetical protein
MIAPLVAAIRLNVETCCERKQSKKTWIIISLCIFVHAFVAAPNGLITAPDLRCACGNLSKTCNLRWEEVGPLPLPSIDVYSHLSAD